MGLAGYRERPPRDDDPLVCSCGMTIGIKLLEKPGNEQALRDAIEKHQPDHARRLAHQAKHRGYAAPANPPEEDDVWLGVMPNAAP